MKALSLKQPWAYFVVARHKDVENRSWQTKHRGPLLIHAGLKWDYEGACWIERATNFELNKDYYERGAIIGYVDMVDCVKYWDSPWFFGPYGFVFENGIEFKKPIPYKGQLGIFEVPDSVISLEKPSET